MTLQEHVPDSLYETSPVRHDYGDPISAAERRQADEQALGRIASLPKLASLDDTLRSSGQALPVIAVRLSTIRGTKEFAQTYIAYGQTEPGQGLRPTCEVTSNHRNGWQAKLGLAMSLDPMSRGSVNYWPSSDWSQDKGSRIVGHWQHLQRDQCTVYNHDLEKTTEYGDEVVEFEDRPFTVWPTGFGRFSEGAPVIINHNSDAREEINRGIREVRTADARGDGVLRVRQGDVWHHTILIGRRAVRAALDSLEGQALHGSELPQPLADMLVAVTDGLGVPA